MVCDLSNINAGFSFGLFAELVYLALFVLLVLHLFSFGVPKNLLGNLVSGSFVLLLVFGIIALASLSSDCIDFATGNTVITGLTAKYVSRLNYAFSRGILALLLGAFVACVVLASKFLSKKNILFKGEAGNKPDPPAPTQAAPATAPEHTAVPVAADTTQPPVIT